MAVMPDALALKDFFTKKDVVLNRPSRAPEKRCIHAGNGTPVL
jgi:hypothetical protein